MTSSITLKPASICTLITVRAGGALSEHLLPPHPLLDFEGADYRAQLTAALKPVLGGALAGSAM